MPRTKVGRIHFRYGRSISNIKSSTLEVLKSIFSKEFTLEKLKVVPSVFEFSVDEEDPAKRRLTIIKRLARIQQEIPAVVLTNFQGEFQTGQVGSGPTESYIDNKSGEKYLGYSCYCPDGTITLDLFAGDQDTLDSLGDSVVTGLLMALNDVNFCLNKTFTGGRYNILYNAPFSRTPGSDNPRDDDPEHRIVTESVTLRIAYEETVFVKAFPSDVTQDAVSAQAEPYAYSSLDDNTIITFIHTNIPATLRVGTKFQAKFSGGSGAYQFGSTNPDVVNIGPTGIVLAMSPGVADIVIEDVYNSRTYSIPIEVSI
jgi:hypothetical protein